MNSVIPAKRQKDSLATLLLCLAVCVSLSACGPNHGAVPSDATFGTCPVCHMKVRTSDDWAAEIHYNNRTKLMFESPGDMFAFYTSPKSYDVDELYKERANIEKIVVKDYQSRQPTDARQAVFVYKSRVIGPMGADFLPFARRVDADAFIAANGGTVLSLDEVTGDMAQNLRN